MVYVHRFEECAWQSSECHVTSFVAIAIMACAICYLSTVLSCTSTHSWHPNLVHAPGSVHLDMSYMNVRLLDIAKHVFIHTIYRYAYDDVSGGLSTRDSVVSVLCASGLVVGVLSMGEAVLFRYGNTTRALKHDLYSVLKQVVSLINVFDGNSSMYKQHRYKNGYSVYMKLNGYILPGPYEGYGGLSLYSPPPRSGLPRSRRR